MQVPAPAHGWIRFGPFALDPRSGHLRNGHREQCLSDQPLALLNALLERPGELVAREELVRRLWPQGTFVDFDHGLNSAISRLREALDDSANVPRFIETVPRRGYRLLVPVEGSLVGREPVPGETAARSDPPAEDALEEHHGQRVPVTELVPGQTLAQRLQHGALPVREALDICRQIAEGLEAAHDAGIVHRDLKPANIKVGPDGRVELLNFGLAEAVEESESGVESTLSAIEATREGAVLETPAYMSPEQARGQAVDRRTDIWAFGCCLYECLTGRSAFKGTRITDTRAAVLNEDPDWSALSDAVPHAVRRLLRRSLAKDVRQRLQHIGDARLDLQEIGSDANEPAAAARQPRRAVP